jgi:phosphoglycolate phosphatase-like HAD superfamily hydrolase
MTAGKEPWRPGKLSGPLLVLDFDGVICDSIEECWASSWTAYHELYRKSGPAPVPRQIAEEFARLRPFIRSGDDFLLIQEMLLNSVTVHDQRGFDAAARDAGAEKMHVFHDLYYKARTALLERDRAAWLAMNRIYPHMVEAFSLLLPSAPFFILSTKKPAFITEVLDAHQIHVAPERILFCDHEPKLPMVEKLRKSGGFTEAWFIEDQIDAIRTNANPRIHVALAAWGYVRQEWLAAPRAVTVLSPEDFLALVGKLYGGA